MIHSRKSGVNGLENKSFKKSLELQSKFQSLIPGGSHTYAKADDQYPEFYAPYLVRGEGCRVWDVDGNEFIEYGMGLRSVSLGHAYPPVVEAAYQQMWLGSNYTRPGIIEVEAAEAFLKLIPAAEMVKFTKNGSDATTAAIKLARAYTGKDMVAFCENHPFFSTDDWFISATAMDRGIPDEGKKLTVKFSFNNIESVEYLFKAHPGRISCLIMEPEKNEPLDMTFLAQTQALCQQNDTLFILDEMITGFRWHEGGAQTLYEIVPDLSTFGKALGNGFAISALTGKRDIMKLGGIDHNDERVFLLSSTHGAEHHALAAAIAVIEEYKNRDVIAYLNYQGNRLRKGMQQCIAAHHLEDYVGIQGHPSCLVYSTADTEKKNSQRFRTLFLQETIKRGLLAPNLVLSFSHSDADVDQTLEIIHDALGVYRKAIDEGIEKFLLGKPVQPVFRKWNHSAYS